MSWSVAFIAVVLIPFNAGSTEILVEPISVNISYGDLASFFCSVRVSFGGLYWLANNELVQTQDGIDFYRSIVGDVQNSTLLVNGLFYKYNNLRIICGVLSTTSSPVILRINKPQTVLNLTLISRSVNSITFGWITPPRLTLQPGDIDILYYEMTIDNILEEKQTNFTLSGNSTHYHFEPIKKSDFCSSLKFCLTPVRSAGVGQVKECVQSSLRRSYIVDGPTNSSVKVIQGKYYVNFTATVACSASSVVLWRSNGKLLSPSSDLHFEGTNNFIKSCSTNNYSTGISSTYTETLEAEVSPSTTLQLHLMSFFYCGEEVEDCMPSVCFSREIIFLSDIKYSLVATNYKEDSPAELSHKNESVTSYSTEVYVLLGVSLILGTALVLVCATCIVLLLLYSKLKKASQKTGLHHFAATNDTHNEIIYEQCGGPNLKNEYVYDKPKTPSPQPNMQPCEAYSTLPAT